ncbi:MAG: 3-phosphoshikimate 1-carboxyvinyltransferase [Ruminococcaceae bacterium]|nr:3-phosphoshikimate 1-carboxyvinyltransferase [Oscillospiraceae bacterium]
MIQKITPSVLSGKIDAIPSKSDAHRLLICAALSKGKTKILLPSTSEDIEATISCLVALGVKVERDGDYVTIEGGKWNENPVLDCKESGSTLRFIIPVASVLCDRVSFTGSGRLPERPISHLTNAMRENGTVFSSDKLPLTKSGKMTSGEYVLPGNVSSQYITGLLFALPLLSGDSKITLTTKLESSHYIDITLFALERFGIKIEKGENAFYVKGNQKYISPKNLTVDSDWSNAAFFLVAGAIGESVTLSSLSLNSKQGDKKIVEVLKNFGAKVDCENGITVTRDKLLPITQDVSEIPDMLPILAVLASFADGKSTFTGGKRLRIKESDRIVTTAAMINALGGKARELEDGLIVEGCSLTGGNVDGAGDHRIVMAAAIAALFCKNEVIINGAEAVNKSYPGFFEDYKKLGGKCYVK